MNLLKSTLRILERNHKIIRSLPSTRRSYSINALSHPKELNLPSNSLSNFGQPLPLTHPHLLKPNELTPGITVDEYESRRKNLMNSLEEGSIVIIAGGKLKYLSGQIFYKFRQSSNFWYLTGWEEPDSVLVLEKTSTLRGYKMTLFCPTKDPNMELWHGARSGSEGAVNVFGADDACDISLLTPRLKSILSAPSSSSSLLPIYVDIPGVPSSSRSRFRRSKIVNSSLLDLLVPTSGGKNDYEEVASILMAEKGRPIKSAGSLVEGMRLIKSNAEIKVMRKAADISSSAHAKVMRFAEATSVSNLTESSLVAHFEYITALAGSPRLAYVPVCASGTSALTLHYVSNQLPLYSNDLLLLDAGCEFGGYASDITRTFPISGTFTSPQKDLYEAVLRVEKECIKFCSEKDEMSLDDLHKKSTDLMKIELKDLGFKDLKGGEMERVLYPHYVGHPLGIDLHDSPTYGRHEKIKAGMVITIEPGLRIPPQSNFPKHFHNLSVRVEDEIHVRKEDYIILSVNAPKEVVDIEACCQGLLES